jgi:hypothetical protein
MPISTRDDLKQYCLRKLGAPVMQINVTPDQIEDCIDDALDSYWEWHHEGSFLDFVSRPLTQNEIDTKEFSVDPWIYQVLGIMMLGGHYSEYNLQYEAFMQGLGSQFIKLGGPQDGAGLVSYVVTQSYLSMVREFFMPEKRIQFNQNHDKIRIHSRMDDLKAGDYLVLEVYRFSDPNTYRQTWNDWWLKAYTTSLIKRQWGMNMIKYSGFQMPSGITLNGREIYQDALAEIEKLETQLITTESAPPDFFIG